MTHRVHDAAATIPLDVTPRSAVVGQSALETIPNEGKADHGEAKSPPVEPEIPKVLATGSVERADRSPASGCTVTFSVWPSTRSYTTQTSEHGEFQIEVGGEQRILGWDLHANDGAEVGSKSSRRGVIGQSIDLGELVLRPAANLNLRVHTYRGGVVGDTRVLLSQSTGFDEVHSWARTDAEGRLTAHLMPGPVFITVSGPFALDEVKIIEAGSNDILVYAHEARPIVVSVATEESQTPIAGAQLELGWQRQVPSYGGAPEMTSVYTHTEPGWRTDVYGQASIFLPPNIAGKISMMARDGEGGVLAAAGFWISDETVQLLVREDATGPRKFALRQGSAAIPEDGTRLACQSGLSIEAVVVDGHLGVPSTANTAFTHVFADEAHVIVLPRWHRQSDQLVVDAPSSVIMRLLDANGEAISGAKVRPVSLAGRHLAKEVATDNSGFARWTKLPPLGAINVVARLVGQSGNATVSLFTSTDGVQDTYCERGRCDVEVFVNGKPEIPADFDVFGFNVRYSSEADNRVSLSWLAPKLVPVPLRPTGNGVAAKVRVLYPEQRTIRVDFTKSGSLLVNRPKWLEGGVFRLETAVGGEWVPVSDTTLSQPNTAQGAIRFGQLAPDTYRVVDASSGWTSVSTTVGEGEKDRSVSWDRDALAWLRLDIGAELSSLNPRFSYRIGSQVGEVDVVEDGDERTVLLPRHLYVVLVVVDVHGGQHEFPVGHLLEVGSISVP